MASTSTSWTRRLDAWALYAFGCGVGFLFGLGQQRALGIAMIASFPLANLLRLRGALRRLRPIPPEIWLHTAWVLWVVVTGPIVAVDLRLFWIGLRLVLQIFAMVWAAYAIVSNLRQADVVFLAIATGGVVQILLVVSGAGSIGDVMDPHARLMGTTNSTNMLGFMMVWTAIGALVFWRGGRRWMWARRAAILVVVAVAAYVMLASGSRKSTLAMGVVIYAWAIFGLRPIRGLRNLLISVIVGIVLVYSFATFLPDFVENTAAGRRFEELVEESPADVGSAIQEQPRYEMYVDGLAIFSENPVFGVGLNNFSRYFRTGQFSHSNLIEPLATTGLPGFLLYQAFYVLLLLRCLRLLRRISDEKTRYRLKIYLFAVTAILIIGAGAPLYANAAVYLILTAISVHSWQLAGGLATRRTAATTGLEDVPSNAIAIGPSGAQGFRQPRSQVRRSW